MAAIGRINFDARKLGAVGDQGAMKVLIKKGFQLANDIKLSMKDSGPAGKRGATREERAANRSKPGEPPHVDTGRLRASIQVNWMGGGETGQDAPPQPSEPFTVRVGTNVEYAYGLEFGTSKVAPRPFLRPALDRLR